MAIAAAAVLGALLTLGVILAFQDRGFDLTDEAFYILNAQEPEAYRMTATLFGYALHPILLLLGGSIQALRVFGIVLLAILGTATVAIYLSERRRRDDKPGMAASVAMLSAGAILPMMYYGFWLPTPSYNWLALAAGLLLLPAVLLLDAEGRGRAFSAVLAAFGGLVAVFARPTTAAADAVVYLAASVVILREPRAIARHLLLVAALTGVGLLVLALLLPVGTIWAQAQGYVEVYGVAPPAPGRGPIGDLVAFVAHPRGWPLIAALAATGFAAFAKPKDWPKGQRRLVEWLAIGGIGAAAVLSVAFPVYPALGPGMAAIALAAVALAVLEARTDRRTALALLLAWLIPWAAGAGTTNDIASQTTFCAGIFGMIALMAGCAARRDSVAVLIALALVLLTGVAVIRGLARPYRLSAPVWLQSEAVAIGATGERLKFDHRAAGFVRALRDSAAKGGFCTGEPVIDLTGELPGVAVMLGGKAPGFPWLFGGYAISERLATWVLDRIPPESRRRAWLVIGEGRIAFSDAFIRSRGFDVSGDYTLLFDGAHPLYNTPVRLYRPRLDPRRACLGRAMEQTR